MKIAILGTGNVGQVLGYGWAGRGYEIIFGSREPTSDKVKALLGGATGKMRADIPAGAVAAADIVLLATPWAAAQNVVQAIPNWQGKILVDATNPIAPGLKLAVPSGGALVANWAPTARVVKAFNTTGANNMAAPTYQGQSITMFIAGDDPAAKAIVGQLAEELGFDVADVGGLEAAGYLEAMALVWIRLAMGQGREIAFKLMRR